MQRSVDALRVLLVINSILHVLSAINRVIMHLNALTHQLLEAAVEMLEIVLDEVVIFPRVVVDVVAPEGLIICGYLTVMWSLVVVVCLILSIPRNLHLTVSQMKLILSFLVSSMTMLSCLWINNVMDIHGSLITVALLIVPTYRKCYIPTVLRVCYVRC